MRLLALLAAIACSITVGSFENRSNHGDVNDSEDDEYMSQRLTQALTEAAEVLEILGNATVQSFAKKFFKIDDQKLTSLSQGALYVSRYTASLLEISDENTALLETVQNGIEKMAVKVYTQEEIYFNASDARDGTFEDGLSEIGGDVNNLTYLYGVKHDIESVKTKLYELYFNAYVMSPLNKTSQAMISYLKDNTSTNLETFKDERTYSDEVRYILKEASNIVKNKIDVSRFDRKTFDETWSNITLYYFQTILHEYFNIGQLRTDEEIMYTQDTSIYELVQNRGILKKAYQETTRYYYNSYFPGFIRQDIIRPAIDNIGGDNCNIAQNIVNQLDSKYPWRKYAVIVSDAVSKSDQYAHFGYPKRMLIDEDYHNKTVIVLMATKNPSKSRVLYLKENGRRIVINIAENSFDIDDLNSVMEYAKNRAKDYQMAAIKSIYKPCLPPLNTNIADAFEVKIPMEVSFPNENQVGVAVIF